MISDLSNNQTHGFYNSQQVASCSGDHNYHDLEDEEKDKPRKRKARRLKENTNPIMYRCGISKSDLKMAKELLRIRIKLDRMKLSAMDPRIWIYEILCEGPKLLKFVEEHLAHYTEFCAALDKTNRIKNALVMKGRKKNTRYCDWMCCTNGGKQTGTRGRKWSRIDKGRRIPSKGIVHIF